MGLLFIVLIFIRASSSESRECVPGSWVKQNNLICYCNQKGYWFDQRCRTIERQCHPGEVKYSNGNKCVCQQDGYLLCPDNNAGQTEHLEMKIGVLCVPSSTYYYDCNVCVCPSNGRTSEAHCVVNKSCLIKKYRQDTNWFAYFHLNVCIPNTSYSYECITCHCTEDGRFTPQKCFNSCTRSIQRIVANCTPLTFYKKQCGFCYCPSNGEEREDLCTKTQCHSFLNTQPSLKNREKCDPLGFTEPKCMYCTYGREGVNGSCLERECINIEDMEITIKKPLLGQIVPFCYQCFCPENGNFNESYCTTDCSHKTRRTMLESFKTEITNYSDVSTQTDSPIRLCHPNTLYEELDRLCLCPSSGFTNNGLCIPLNDKTETQRIHSRRNATKTTKTDSSYDCEPNTFVFNDCNICYCNKKGKLDSKWCTYDDCKTKTKTKENHNATNETHKINSDCIENCTNEQTVSLKTKHFSIEKELHATCEAGSLAKFGCNLCICPKSGLQKDWVCTKNDCNTSHLNFTAGKSGIECTPLAYYTVGCNVCFCPKDGIKNVAKCTKNVCEKSYLRSSACNPGELFSDSCNICICPQDGDDSGRVCTDHECRANVVRSMLSQTSNDLSDVSQRNVLDICFPGEEFTVDCDLCVCPDMGLKAYATCTKMFCDGKDEDVDQEQNQSKEPMSFRYRRDADEACISYNATNSAERAYCTAGSMYIIRCRQCFCPYLGNINHFCRPLPKNFHCEEAYPGFNYLPMGRRDDNETSTKISGAQTIHIRHNHTEYYCEEKGMVSDDCFICECVNGTVIEEHCFKSDSENCTTAAPTFLRTENKLT